ncbi:MAG: archease [Fibrobacter sp.]|nr:archease [Fibrobacter sp.]
MPYKYIEDKFIADVAFEAWGGTREELFMAASDATAGLMVENLKNIENINENSENKIIELKETEIDMLLFDVLQELIFFKDAYQLICRFRNVKITSENKRIVFKGTAVGEKIDYKKHNLAVDVKAVTLHEFKVQYSNNLWKAHVVLDI